MKTFLITIISLMTGVSAQATDATTWLEPTETLAAADRPDTIRDSSNDRNIILAALKGWQVAVGAGLELGGASPVPIPRSIRKINSFNPLLNLYLEGTAYKSFTPRWGMALGLRFETKGMKTNANVKNYHMAIIEDDGGHMEGGWNGPVITKYRATYITVPVLATYTFSNPRWMVSAGPYFSLMLNGDFDGYVHDGYIRTPDELGENVNVTHATYDFSNNLRKFQWGLQVGGSFHAYKHLYVNANLDWGLNGIFPSDFKTISFALYPIYGTLGFSYLF